MKAARPPKKTKNMVEFLAEDIEMPSWIKRAGVYVNKVLSGLNIENWELSILFCSNRYIKTLNRQYRNVNEATDVLSFSMGEKNKDGSFMAGDIIISLDALEENERLFSVDIDEELRRLLIHGILHLSGEDHKSNAKNEPMIIKQEEILLKIDYDIIDSCLVEVL